MRNLISYNPSFIWDDKQRDRNSCINCLNSFYLEAKKQDRLFIKQDLNEYPDSIVREFNLYKPFDELKQTFPWLTSDSYAILNTTLHQIKKTSVVSDLISDYNTDHEFNHSSWMGFCEQNISNYAHDLNSWRRIHRVFVMNYSRSQRQENKDYFKKFREGQLKIAVSEINRKIRNGNFKHFDSIHVPKEIDGKPVHEQQIHIHLKNDGALNIDGTEKHKIKKIPNAAADDLVAIGFILPEDLT